MATKEISSLIWTIADSTLRGVYKEKEWGNVILPFLVLRRLDCVINPLKEEAIKEHGLLTNEINNPEKAVLHKLKISFYNISKYDLKRLTSDPTNIYLNVQNYLEGYSSNVRNIIENFNLRPIIDKLDKQERLYKLIEKFSNVDLHPSKIDNHQMGTIYEELIRRFSEESNETSGEHFTPRDIVSLLVKSLFHDEKNELQQKGLVRTIYDPTCGTGGMLSVSKSWILDNINKDIEINLFGQELNDQTLAICKSDQLISGEDPNNIYGPKSTLTNDFFENNTFDYIIANPPFGQDWKDDKDSVLNEAEKENNRFKYGIPSVRDGSLLFLQHMISKMNPSGSKIGVILSNSALTTGKANSGESRIRKGIIEDDLLETIVMLPDSLFFNTFITTYIVILNNKKKDFKKGRVQLINASEYKEFLQRKLNLKNSYIPEKYLNNVTNQIEEYKNSENSLIVNSEKFLYKQFTVETQHEVDNKLVFKKDGSPKPDPKLKDDSHLLQLDADEKKYFNFLENSKNRWVNDAKTQIGCEINLPKQFYKPNEITDSNLHLEKIKEGNSLLSNVINSLNNV
ncbi:type I restriction-modification system subunit M [Acidimicrobiia bacterium]|nr:type I restriction-modification system subunit M [Acidimicrobiia bacterium]